MTQPLKIGLIHGSTRQGRFCDTITRWIAQRVEARGGWALVHIDPASADPAVLNDLIGDADAFIVATPEYNHSYPAPLKELIDGAKEEWEAKPVAFVSYGGISGGLRAVEHLRGVFAELHAVGIRDSVSFASAWEQFDAEGRLHHPERAERSMRVVLDRLAWWATALRNARTAQPYRDAA